MRVRHRPAAAAGADAGRNCALSVCCRGLSPIPRPIQMQGGDWVDLLSHPAPIRHHASDTPRAHRISIGLAGEVGPADPAVCPQPRAKAVGINPSSSWLWVVGSWQLGSPRSTGPRTLDGVESVDCGQRPRCAPSSRQVQRGQSGWQHQRRHWDDGPGLAGLVPCPLCVVQVGRAGTKQGIMPSPGWPPPPALRCACRGRTPTVSAKLSQEACSQPMMLPPLESAASLVWVQ